MGQGEALASVKNYATDAGRSTLLSSSAGHCVNLEYLLLSKTRIQGPLKKLALCTQLRHLDVRECRRLKGELSDLRGMRKLTHLFTNLTPIEGNATDIKQFKVRLGERVWSGSVNVRGRED